MGLDRFQKTPCGFCFVEYYTHQDALDCMKYIGGTKLDERVIRTDLDEGFAEGRQYGYAWDKETTSAKANIYIDAANLAVRCATNTATSTIPDEVASAERWTSMERSAIITEGNKSSACIIRHWLGFGVGSYPGRHMVSMPSIIYGLQVEYGLGKASNNAVSPGNAFCMRESS
jgi:hypothetical protein